MKCCRPSCHFSCQGLDSEEQSDQESEDSFELSENESINSTSLIDQSENLSTHEIVLSGSGSFTTEVDTRFAPFVSEGIVTLPQCESPVAPPSESRSTSVVDTTVVPPCQSNVQNSKHQNVKISILRDTGSSQSLLLKGVLDFSPEHFTGQHILISGISGQTLSVPLYRVQLESGILSPKVQEVVVGVAETLPVGGVQFLLGNELAFGKVSAEPIVSQSPIESVSTEKLESEHYDCLPACVVTRSMQRKQDIEDREEYTSRSDIGSPLTYDLDLSETFMNTLLNSEVPLSNRQGIVEAQKDDPELQILFSQALDSAEAEKVAVCFVVEDGLLSRKWRNPVARVDDPTAVTYQIVAPQGLRLQILDLAHDNPMAGHLGVKKTKARVLEHFWWPRVSKSIIEYVRSCRTCQIVGKSQQKPKRYPLRPIPVVDEPFTELLIDIVGPLSKTSKGHEYILTILTTSTRFPEAIPLRKCTAQAVTDALLKYFTLFGIPLRVRSDQGTHFTANIMKETLKHLGVQQVFGCAYRPQTQGAIERFHETLKFMIKTYIYENEKDWDVGLPFLLFAARNSVHESLGFSPAELVFGHKVRGPLKLLRDRCFEVQVSEDILSYVAKMKARLRNAIDIAHQNLDQSQTKMKEYYDLNTVSREFQIGDQVLVLLPIPGDPLKMTFSGPYGIKDKVDDINYVIATPDRRKKTQLCHINQMKRYYHRQDLTISNSDMITKEGLAFPKSLPGLASHTPLPKDSEGPKEVKVQKRSRSMILS